MKRNKVKNLIFGAMGMIVLLSIGLSKVEGRKNVQIERGKYLVENVAACGQCHTPRIGAKSNAELHLAGFPEGSRVPKYDFQFMRQGIFIVMDTTMTAFSGPFGTVFATNLTPDGETGLGEWTEKMFISSIRTGHHQGDKRNRKLFPPMPIRNYAKMTDADLQAIWAYLQSLKPIKNRVPPVLNPRGRAY